MSSLARTCARLGLLSAAVLLTACASGPADVPSAAAAPARWASTLPHEGHAAGLAGWWSRFDDPLLPELVSSAERDSPSVAQALARIGQARAALRSTRAGLWPQINLATNAAAVHEPGQDGHLYTASAGADAAWEIDLFGARRQSAAAAQARVEGSRLAWHDARVSLAAEVAQTYVSLRTCEALAAVYEEEAGSQGRIAELTRQKVKVGFDAPATGALAEAGAAEAANRLAAQRADCAAVVHALVALTGLPYDALARQLADRRARLPAAAPFQVAAVPAAVLAQRPDVAAAQRELAAAAADVGAAQAQRFPVLSLAGTIAAVATRVAGITTHGSSWSIAPAASLPLFDGGLRAAGVEGAQARYDEARALFEQRARQAVREVEEALLRLDAAQRREADAQRAARGYREYFAAAQNRWQVGAGSLIEMEDARRLSLNAQAALVGVQRERVAAWITLYKAVGGGWDAGTPAPDATANNEGQR
ncbi:efflux transporter outer membrane subunit [Ideonella sp. BN130291]|uniref:efflux transporter outer membrane subunit n=1 Tax=Ideonella sp. BN130291 TaxID=3112940 RepID=UPI002E27170F|nr:efflux transporter outer membrane subunit [Ideonella sp. BN130291]